MRTRFEKDYYRLLDLTQEATADEIRRTYRRLALRWHPDRNPGDPAAAERFKEISEAYAVLIDPAKRRAYDEAWQAGAAGQFRHTREEIFRDLFADPRASAIFEELAREFERLGLRVDRHHFKQTLYGGRVVITGGVFIIGPWTPVLALGRLARAALRGARTASRAGMPADSRRPLAAPEPRALPGPGGVLRALGRVVRWFFETPAAPDTAVPRPDDIVLPLRLTRDEAERGGRRRVVIDARTGQDEVIVTIPPGIRAGTRLRLRGKGRAGAGGARGDAYLAIEVAD